jgi:hypothetical protein
MYTFGDECKIGEELLRDIGSGSSAPSGRYQQLIDWFSAFKNL